MSTKWRCAVCEAVNDGGDTCTACGARVIQTVVQARPAEATPVPEGTAAPEGAPAPTLGDDAATEVPVRELPRRGRLEPDRPPDDGPYEVYDLFDVVSPAEADPAYGTYEPIDTRPRVRVYGCCLPIALAILLLVLTVAAAFGNLLLAAL